MAQVQLTTDVKSFYRNQVTSAASNPTNKVPTTTQPVTATGTVVLGTSLNYLKFKIFSSATTSATLNIYGWSFWPDAMAWVPQLLCSVQCAFNSTANTLPGITGNVYESASFTLQNGDAKIYNGVLTTASGGFILVDTLGSQFVEVHGTDTTTSTVFYLLTAGL
jgi:hypothetical protein